MPLNKRLIIIGARNLGRELLAWASHIPSKNRNWEVYGFLDDNPNALDGMHIELPIIDSVKSYNPAENDIFVIGVASPEYKLEVGKHFIELGAEFANIIHPTSIIGPHCNIGKGLIMCPYSVITSHVTIGNFVTINVHSSIGHDAIVEDGCTLSGHCDVTGYAHLGRGVFMGSGARVLPKSKIGQFATVGAGSVVLKKVKEHRTVLGVPAQYID